MNILQRLLRSRKPALNKPVVKRQLNFCFRGVEYTEGDKVRVSKHYACYKQQYNFMIGTVYLGVNNIPMVRIEINPNDIEQQNEIQLECWGDIAKI